ncbi:MAG: lamin tail domain-containing protein [Candidatus Hydrogenedentota bacterium]|nr:MAG: lamin tail domain-containing protein [Candidatus Hydrogenedentota bacterium]
MKNFILLPFLLFFLHCSSIVDGSKPENQGFLWQLPDGNLQAYLNSKGLHDDPRLKKTSVIMMYIYKKGAEIDQPCDSSETADHCLDSFGFANDPGYFGYDPQYKNYSPLLMSDGTNPHPITYLNLDLSTHIMPAFAASGSEFASTYFYDYNEFQSLNHVVFDGDRFDVYFAVHFNAMKEAANEKDRFDPNSSVWLRPVAPDLISPKISIKIKLLAEGPQDEPGNYYEIPDYSTWKACPKETANSNDVVISEIFWGDSVADDGSSKSTGDEDEFVEIANISGKDLNIGYWKLRIDSTEFTLPPCVELKAGEELALVSHKKYAFSETGLFLSGLDLVENGSSSTTTMSILDSSGNTIYSLTCDPTTNWPAGAANQSMVQKNNPPQAVSDCTTTSWQTNTIVGNKISSLYNNGTYATPGEHP